MRIVLIIFFILGIGLNLYYINCEFINILKKKLGLYKLCNVNEYFIWVCFGECFK